MSDHGQQVLFDQRQARAGLEAFVELNRCLSPLDYNLTYDNLSSTLDLSTAGLLADPALDVDQTLAKYLDLLARMFDRMLSR